MNYIRTHPLLTAILVNIVLFSIVFIFCFPIFNSGDDVFLLYLVSGGFGDPPTELLHYNYGMHPYLGLPLKSLFTQFPGVNWYSCLLYLFHFIACIIILWHQLKKNVHWSALAGYLLLFFAIEMRFLLQPSFTNTALVTAASGLLMVLSGYRLTGYALVLLSTVFRLHLIIPVLIIAAPFIFIAFNKKTLRRFLPDTIAVAALIIALILLQERYYTKHIPGWQEEERYRQAVIDYYNSPKIISYNFPEVIKLKAEALNDGMLWDKEFLSAEQIALVRQFVGIKGAWQYDDFGERLYWIFMENRLGLLVLLVMLWWKLPTLSGTERKATLVSLLFFAGLCAAMLLLKKLPAYLVTGSMLQLLALLGNTGNEPITVRPLRKWLFIFFAGLLLVWSIIRMYKTSGWNREHHAKWLCAYKDVSSHPDKLFVVTDDKFPMDYFHVWNDPQQFKLSNLLYRDHFQNNIHQSAYSRFNIRPDEGLLTHTKVVFVGSEHLLFDFFNESKGERIVSVPGVTGTCLKMTTLSNNRFHH